MHSSAHELLHKQIWPIFNDVQPTVRHIYTHCISGLLKHNNKMQQNSHNHMAAHKDSRAFYSVIRQGHCAVNQHQRPDRWSDASIQSIKNISASVIVDVDEWASLLRRAETHQLCCPPARPSAFHRWLYIQSYLFWLVFCQFLFKLSSLFFPRQFTTLSAFGLEHVCALCLPLLYFLSTCVSNNALPYSLSSSALLMARCGTLLYCMYVWSTTSSFTYVLCLIITMKGIGQCFVTKIEVALSKLHSIM